MVCFLRNPIITGIPDGFLFFGYFTCKIQVIAPPILLALTFHEYAHAYVADKYGDDTAKQSGRLTLNPLAHLDPLGTTDT